MTELLPREFFDRSALEVAPDLLGCVLEHETADGLVAVALTEVEAYMGAADPASHAYRGQTRRNAVMFGPPGHAYVYFTYGMHFCVNVVCLPAGMAEAVLLRAGTVIAGEELASRRRAANGRAPGGGHAPVPESASGRALADGGEPAAGALPGRGPEAGQRAVARAARDLARGPARLCQALGIDRALDGADLCVPVSPLRLRDRAGAAGAAGGPGGDGTARSGEKISIRTGPRVGVRMGADVPWRFWLDGEPTVSAYRPYARRRR